MKKLVTLLCSVLVFTGLKAQSDSSIKKETTPGVNKMPADSLTNRNGAVVKQNAGIVVKGKNTLPSKAIIIPDTDKPVKGSTTVKPLKF